jgi:hypothetical protein
MAADREVALFLAAGRDGPKIGIPHRFVPDFDFRNVH